MARPWNAILLWLIQALSVSVTPVRVTISAIVTVLLSQKWSSYTENHQIEWQSLTATLFRFPITVTASNGIWFWCHHRKRNIIRGVLYKKVRFETDQRVIRFRGIIRFTQILLPNICVKRITPRKRITGWSVSKRTFLHNTPQIAILKCYEVGDRQWKQ